MGISKIDPTLSIEKTEDTDGILKNEVLHLDLFPHEEFQL